jgi:protein-L-isoaspartate(D-aspartate) O-methyltransferase
MQKLTEQRRQLVERQIRARGITDPAVLAAFAEVPREAFLSQEMAEFAYFDTALPIEMEQTISQPYIVALMTEALELTPAPRTSHRR